MSQKDIKVGIIGAGNIANLIASKVRLDYVYDIDDNKSVYFFKKYNCKKVTFDQLLSSNANLIVEAASQQAVKSHALDVLNSGKNLMIMSVGALADEQLFSELLSTAEKKGLKVIIPSGAIVGIDGLSSASIATIDEVMITTTKSPKNLGLEDITGRKTLFEGNAREAVEKFPANVNISATVSLAGIGFSKTRVRIIADPDANENTHELTVKGDFGTFTTITKNLPSLNNPKTSQLAALSAVDAIKRFSSVLNLGN